MSAERKAELAWKWMLRIGGLIGVGATAIAWQDAPVAWYVLLGGMMGLPSVWTWKNGEEKQ